MGYAVCVFIYANHFLPDFWEIIYFRHRFYSAVPSCSSAIVAIFCYLLKTKVSTFSLIFFSFSFLSSKNNFKEYNSPVVCSGVLFMWAFHLLRM